MKNRPDSNTEYVKAFRVFFGQKMGSLVKTIDDTISIQTGIRLSQSSAMVSDKPKQISENIPEWNVSFHPIQKVSQAYDISFFDSKQIIVVKTYDCVYVWIGENVSPWVSKYSLEIAKLFINQNIKQLINFLPPYLAQKKLQCPSIQIIFQGGEPAKFKACFPNWKEQHQDFIANLGANYKIGQNKKIGKLSKVSEFEDMISSTSKFNSSKKINSL
jgi:hypothetical protein